MTLLRFINQRSALILVLVVVAAQLALLGSVNWPLVVVLAVLLSLGSWRLRPKVFGDESENLPTLLIFQSRY